MDDACLCHTMYESVPPEDFCGRCCRWEDFFGNCTSLLKRTCRVDIMVSVWSCLGCSFNTVLLQGSFV